VPWHRFGKTCPKLVQSGAKAPHSKEVLEVEAHTQFHAARRLGGGRLAEEG
jgi:hypothetical protein